jgi:hypothetical protein
MTTVIIIIAVVVAGIVIYNKTKGGNGPQNPSNGGQGYGSTGGSSYSGGYADGVQR